MRQSRILQLGPWTLGGGHPVRIQSMTNTPTSDTKQTLAQICRLAKAGCEIVRVALPGRADADALPAIIAESPLPVIADIHFDAELALSAIAHKVAGIRINPGNLAPANLQALAEKAGENGIPIRVGANSGSVKKSLLDALSASGLSRDEAMAQALCQSALEQCRLLEKYGFCDIKVSLKSSSVPVNVKAYRRFAAETDYPLHLGVTEAGTLERGLIKSAIGIGSLLLDGIGDTIRVSLTADPVAEIGAAIRILESCGLREAKPEIISCPSCGRTTLDLVKLAEKVENLVAKIKSSGNKINLNKIAVMGCAVNGPGEAREADLGIAGAKNRQAILFAGGKVIASCGEDEILQLLESEIKKHLAKK